MWFDLLFYREIVAATAALRRDSPIDMRRGCDRLFRLWQTCPWAGLPLLPMNHGPARLVSIGDIMKSQNRV